MCLRRAPEKYIVGAALDRAALVVTGKEHCIVLQIVFHCEQSD
jgi:hypothetical protein